MNVHIAFDIDTGVLATLRKDSNGFREELRIAAAVKWYELGMVSQGRAAEIADLSRTEFIAALRRYGVTPFQQTSDEIIADAEEAGRG